MEREEAEKKEARPKAYKAKQKEVSQLWQDKEFLVAAGYEVDLPIGGSQ